MTLPGATIKSVPFPKSVSGGRQTPKLVKSSVESKSSLMGRYSQWVLSE